MQQSETKDDLSDEDRFKLQCLARHLLRKPLGKRRCMLKNMAKIHGDDVVETIKLVMKSEFDKIQEKKRKAKLELKEILGK